MPVDRNTNGLSMARDEAGMQQFSVSFAYPVHFCREVFEPDNPLLEATIARLEPTRRHRVMVFVDAGLAAARPELMGQCCDYVAHHPQRLERVGEPRTVPGGEQAKVGLKTVESILADLAAQRLCRQSVVLAIGGGSMLDIVGFAASLFHRGVRVVRVPSSTLAQCDSGVGVKTGIDAFGAKNGLGTFAPPFAVLNDLALLSTLPDRYWIGGMAEAWKVAIIRDAVFFDWLVESAEALAARDARVAEVVLRRAAALHLQHIRESGDPFEFGSARPLDFGHWSAHALERLSGYRLGHGEAVSLGIALDTCVAVELGRLPRETAAAILDGLRRTGLPLWAPELTHCDGNGAPVLYDGLAAFREHLGGSLALTLPTGIGSAVEIDALSCATVQRALDRLRAFVTGKGQDGAVCGGCACGAGRCPGGTEARRCT